MTKTNKLKKKYYGVRVGRKTGVFETWEDCQEQVTGVKGAKYKGFEEEIEAKKYVRGEIEEKRNDMDENQQQEEEFQCNERYNEETRKEQTRKDQQIEDKKERNKESQKEEAEKELRTGENEKMGEINDKEDKTQEQKGDESEEMANYLCPKCNKKVGDGVYCEKGKRWWHFRCQGTTKKEIDEEYGVGREFKCTKCIKEEEEEERQRIEKNMIEIEKRIYRMQIEKDEREDTIKKIKAESKQIKQDMEELRNEMKHREEAHVLEIKASKEETKKKQKEIEKLRKEVSKQYETIEEERMEKTKLERKVIQIEENYKETVEINERLERELDKKQTREKKVAGRERKACIWFAKEGWCKFGEECKYDHNRICSETEKGIKCSKEGCKDSHDGTVMCKWDEKCEKGMYCKFIHKKRKEGRINKSNEKGREIPSDICRWGEKCRYGEKCRFKHAERNKRMGKGKEEHNEERMERIIEKRQNMEKKEMTERKEHEKKEQENKEKEVERKIIEMEERMVKRIAMMIEEEMKNVRREQNNRHAHFWQEPDQNYYQQNEYRRKFYNQIQQQY